MNMFKGSMVAIVTPMNEDGSLDFISLKNLIEFHIENQTDVIISVGTTGESATLDFDEHSQVIKKTIEFVNGRIPVIAGTGANSTSEAIELTKSAKNNGADGCLLVAPYYNKPNQEGLYQHFKTIANNSSLPVILYNVPSRTGVNIAPETVLRLAQDFDNIVALKEASGDFQQAQTLMKLCPPNFSILSGDDEMSLPMILAGAKGVISVIGNAIPEQYSRIIKEGLSRNVDKAYLIQYQLLDLIRMIYFEGNPTGIKVLMETLGLCENNLRLPLVPASKELTLQLKEELKKGMPIQTPQS